MAMSDVIARLSVWLGLDTAAFEKGADVSERRLKKMEREFAKLGDRIGDIGKKFTVAITAPVLAAGAAIGKSAADFEQSMIKLGISSQATAGELKEMSELALKLGKDTTFGASDAANAMDELAKSGLSAREILDGAAAAAVNLASATGSELSPAANAITDTMKQFGLSTAQLPNAVNQITGAVNQSKLDFADYALAIGQAGGVAGGLGVEFTDFNAVLAGTSSLFASGSDAGTSFKTFLTSLSGNSKEAKKAIAAFGLSFFDANGNLRSMSEIAEELRTKLGNLNDEAKNDVLKDIFGTDAMRTAIGLMNQGSEGLGRIAEAIRKTDAAAQAQERLKGFYGQLENLKGAIETLAIRIGQSGVLEAFTAVITKLGDLIDWLSETNPAILRFIAIAAGIAAVIGPATIAIGALTRALAPLLTIIKVQMIPALVLFKLELAALAVAGGPAAVAMRILAVAVRGLLIATGVGVAIAVLAGAIYLMMRRTNEATPATKAYAQALNTAEQASKNAEAAANNLAAAHGKSRENALRAAIAERELTKQKLAGAQASLILAEYEAIRARAKARDSARLASGTGPGEGVQGRISNSQQRFNRDRGAAAQADANAKAAEAAVIELKNAKATLDKAIDAAMAPLDMPKVAGPNLGSDEKRNRQGRSGRTPAEMEEQFQNELANYAQQALSARQQMVTSAQEQAELELRSVELARVRTLESIKADKDYSKAQKARLADAVENLAELERSKIERDLRLRLFQEANDLAESEYRASSDALRLQYELADTDADRKRIALQILDAEDAYLRSKLEAVVANTDLAKAVRQQAQIELDALNATADARRETAARANETPGERYAREINKTPAQISEALEGIKVDGLKALNQGLTDAIMGFRSLGDVAKNVLQQITSELINLAIRALIIKPLAGALGIPGFAMGTNFAPGGLAMVGERGPELVNLPRGSQVIPNHELAGMGGGSNVYKPTFIFPGVTNAAQAREAGAQAARRFRQGINGPVRT